MTKFHLNFLEKKILNKIITEDKNSSSVDLTHITQWFRNEFRTKGSTAQGVGWRDEKTQELRYNALLDIFQNVTKKASVLEVGCGYGHIVHTLREILGENFKSYKGLDINPLIISSASHVFEMEQNISFENKGVIDSYADYIIASGLFGFKGENNTRSWEKYVESTLDDFNNWSRVGFAVNFLSHNSSTNDKRFYYANPSDIFRICQEKYGYKVVLNHSYLQNDFTIIVTKME